MAHGTGPFGPRGSGNLKSHLLPQSPSVSNLERCPHSGQIGAPLPSPHCGRTILNQRLSLKLNLAAQMQLLLQSDTHALLGLRPLAVPYSIDSSELCSFRRLCISVCFSVMPSLPNFRAVQRSSHAPIAVVIVIEGGVATQTCEGKTIVVNRHGALVATAKGLRIGMRISIYAHVTDKRAMARVVYIDPKNPHQCGIELDEPQNIWGVPLPSDDWEEKMAPERIEVKAAAAGVTRKKESRCPYCVVGDKFPPMTVLSNGSLICPNCGHIVIPDDSAFKCPCRKCLEIDFSPRVRRLRGGNHGPKS